MQQKVHVWRASYWYLGTDEINDWPDVSPFHSRYLAGNREYLIFLLVKGIWQKKKKKHISSLGFLLVTNPLMWNTRKPHNELHLTQCHIDYEVGPMWIWIPYKKVWLKNFSKIFMITCSHLSSITKIPNSGGNEEEAALHQMIFKGCKIWSRISVTKRWFYKYWAGQKVCLDISVSS